MKDLYVGLGGNLGNREQLLSKAVEILTERMGELKSLSAFYETEPWGFHSDHSFLNAVAVFRTDKMPEEILRLTQTVERELGRFRKSTAQEYADRPIDIDLLLYGDMVLEEDFEVPGADGVSMHLSLPHPLMHKRRFVMEPLVEIAPNVMHPLLQKTFREILEEL